MQLIIVNDKVKDTIKYMMLKTDKLGSEDPILFKHLLQPNDHSGFLSIVDICRVGNDHQGRSLQVELIQDTLDLPLQ